MEYDVETAIIMIEWRRIYRDGVNVYGTMMISGKATPFRCLRNVHGILCNSFLVSRD